MQKEENEKKIIDVERSKTTLTKEDMLGIKKKKIVNIADDEDFPYLGFDDDDFQKPAAKAKPQTGYRMVAKKAAPILPENNWDKIAEQKMFGG